MFTDNKYTTVYHKIIARAQLRGLNKHLVPYYTEYHHIMPTALQGSNDACNLVLLTAKEHVVCHHLLTKMVTGGAQQLMLHAFGFMCRAKSRSQQRRIRGYQYQRVTAIKRNQEWCDNISKGRTGIKVAYKKRQPLSPGHRAKIQAALKQRGIPAACLEARMLTLIKPFSITFPSGEHITVTNLKLWCANNNYNYSSAFTNTRLAGPIARGPMKGFKFKRLI